MTSNHPAGLTPQECLRLLVEHRRSWLLPTAVCAVLATVFSLWMPRFWQASQAMIVRREASATSAADPGKFPDLWVMRTFQETILELSKSPQVVAATIRNVTSSEPTAEEVEKFRKRLSMTPPGGAEFGKTEVFYFGIQDTDKSRAIGLVAELGKQIDLRLRELREERLQGLITELEQQVALANTTHEAESQRLAMFEANVGSDLGELRMLNASSSGQSDLRQQAVALSTAGREAEIALRTAEQLLFSLQTADKDAERLIAMPNSLLISQPTLRRLKDGLVDAQLRAARLGGTRTANHPQVRAAVDAIAQIRSDLHDELRVAISGVELEIQLDRNRADNLERQHTALQLRLSRLAELRAGYSDRLSAAKNSRLVLDQARKQLGEIRASQVAARSASLVTTLDRPETGSSPVGPGRVIVVLASTFGGLFLGVGWVFLTTTSGGVPRASEEQQVYPVQPVSVAERIAKIVTARDAHLSRS